MKYFEVETKSRSGKSHGWRWFFADSEEAAREKMKKLRLPVYSIKEIAAPQPKTTYKPC